MKILVTGAAGFIGFHTCKKLITLGYNVIGLDNISDYYDINLKYARLFELGISKDDASVFNKLNYSKSYKSKFKFIRLDIGDREKLPILFDAEKFDVVCNLAAQAGVRYSIQNPEIYIDSNVSGFLNILECCRNYTIKHLVYASSSSVYGLNDKIPFETKDNTDSPISLYAATKKSNELMAHTYCHLFGFKTTGLRFFTVYGPWGRPDMALFLFTDAIINNKPINVFNHGNMERDFTYIDDIVGGVTKIATSDNSKPLNPKERYNLYNIGNNNAVKLTDFIESIEDNLNKKAVKNLLPIQDGDVEKTWANVDQLISDHNYKPNTTIKTGIKNFIDWYKEYYNIPSS